jgi:FMN phosphatase YigB (HAD superfamily)
MKKIKYFIDFDDTLFDRNKFRNDLFSLIENLGFSRKELESSYIAVYRDGYMGIWSQLNYLNENVKKFDLQGAKIKVDKFLNETNRYLYKDSVAFLKEINRNKYQVELLTVGGLKFQKEKVENSGIVPFFDKCNFTTLKKYKALKNLVRDNEKFILIDDKESETKNVALNYPNAIVIKTGHGHLLDHLDPII